MGTSDLGNNMPAPYGLDLGDLNHDAFTDVVIVDDGSDKFRLGTGVGPGPLFYATWQSPTKNFSFIPGASSDPGFGHNPYIRDLDGNGWNDVLITDVDGDLTGCGPAPVDLSQPAARAGRHESRPPGRGPSWPPATTAPAGRASSGMLQSDLRGCYDVGFGDFDHDGDLDLMLGLCSGTNYWQNETDPTYCQTDLGFAGPGNGALTVCGGAPWPRATGDAEDHGRTAELDRLHRGRVLNNPSPLKGGTLVPVPIFLLVPVATSPSGTVTLPGVKGGGGPVLCLPAGDHRRRSQPAGLRDHECRSGSTCSPIRERLRSGSRPAHEHRDRHDGCRATHRGAAA